MSKKRVNGEGTITKLSDKKYMGKIMVGWKPDGKPDRVSVYGKNEKEVSIKLREISSQLAKGTYIHSCKDTFGEWVVVWLKDYKSIKLKPRTYDIYESQINTHIIPELGDIQLKDLKSHQLQHFYNKKYNAGQGLASATIKKIHSIINSSLKQALINDLIIKNPSEGVELPALEQKIIKSFTEEEHTRFFEAAKKSDYFNAFLLADYTGVRMGELLALKWDDIDLENGQLSITKTLSLVKDRKGISKKKYLLVVQKPKTKASIRTLPLTKNAIKMLSELKVNKSSKSNLVFPSRKNTYIYPRNFERSFQNIVLKAGIEECNTHTLRHTFATRCFEKGINLKIISKWLGHSKIAHTLDIYTHIMPDTEKNAVRILESPINKAFEPIQ